MSDLILDNDISNGENALSANSMKYLKETGKWAKFLAIIGFIGLGLMVIFSLWGLTMGASMGSFGGAFGAGQLAGMSFAYLIMAALYFFPIYYLYKFGEKMGDSMRSSSSMSMESAFENLKSHYKFMGIFMIVILSIYVLIFLFGIIMAIAS